MTYNRRLTFAAFVSLVAIVSCLQGAKAPHVTPLRTLETDTEGPGTLSRKGFGVVFAGPRGQTVDPSEVTIVFNRPMRPLELASDGPERGPQPNESAPPATIAPAPK